MESSRKPEGPIPFPLPDPLRDRLEKARGDRAAQGLFRRRLVDHSPRSMVSEKPLNLKGNDYLCLSHDPQVIEGATRAVQTWGASATASPLVCGYLPVHEQLEKVLADWHGYPHALVMVSGFAANRSVLGHLPRTGDLVLADRLVHNSILSGIQSSGAKLHRFPHNDLDHLEEWLVQKCPDSGQVFVVTETVFSMDGDGPDLARMMELRRKHSFVLILDEAHAIGWHGQTGAGMLEEQGFKAQADIVVGTLGKALGSQGAYVLAHDERVIDYLVNFSGEYIYSTFLAPAAVGAATVAQRRIIELGFERPGWHQMSRKWREGLGELGLAGENGHSPIISLPLGDPEKTISISGELARKGILVSAIRPPTVPPGTSRLRLSLHRQLTQGDQNRVLGALKELI